jgi:putative membrane protein
MTPNFTVALLVSVVSGCLVLLYFAWRFGLADAFTFLLLAGGFAALLDFLNFSVAKTYDYPGQSALWVLTFILFGWTGTCGSCLLVAEGILAAPGQDMLTQVHLWWKVPLLTSVLAVLLDLFVDPIAVAAGYWVWLVKGTVYYEIPLLNFVGWFVLMLLAPLGWILIARQQQRSGGWKAVMAVAALVPLAVAAVLLSVLLNGMVSMLGLK